MNKKIQNNSICCLFLIAMMMNLSASVSRAEVVMDGTLGPQGPLAGPAFNISDDLGETVGTNLFHSFESFNIASDESANFTGPDSINNIISRVTGGGSSTIDGLINSEIGSANLYFVNPAGVIFGPNASLDVTGSFSVSTANYLLLGNSGRFDATNPANSVLTAAPPSAFGFIDNDPAGIAVHQSTLEVPSGETLSLLGGDIEINEADIIAPAGRIDIASVASPGEIVPNPPGETDNLEMVSFDNFGTISGSDALVDAGGAGVGTVIIRGGRFLLDTSYVYASVRDNGNDNQGAGIDVELSGNMIFDASEIGANVFTGVNIDSGGVRITADSIEMKNSSQIQSVGYFGSGSGSSGDIILSANNNVTVDSGSYIRTGTGGSGNSGDININAPKLAVRDGGQIFSLVFGGTGNGGNINIVAAEVDLSNNTPDYLATGIKTQAQSSAIGDAGDVNILAKNLRLTSATEISTTTYTDSNGGNIQLTCEEDISMQGNKDLWAGRAGIFSNTLYGSGQGGNLQLSAKNLEMTTNSSIEVLTRYGTGNAGNVRIEAESVQLRDVAYINTSCFDGNGGNAGDVHIEAESVQLRDVAYINTNSYGGNGGNAGDVEVLADRIYIAGPETPQDNTPLTGLISTTGTSGGNAGQLNITATDNLTLTNKGILISASFGPGAGGNTTINAGRLEMTNGAQINAVAAGTGDAGAVQIDADQVYLSGVHPLPITNLIGELQLTPSAISTQTHDKGGKAGEIVITAKDIELNDGATIDARTYGPADGGVIRLIADRVSVSGENADMREFLLNQGSELVELSDARSRVTTSSEGLIIGDDATGNAGDIFIEAAEINLFDMGLIDSSTKTPGIGGNVNLLVNRIEISGDARVRAISTTSPKAGKAGNINILAQDTLDISSGTVSTSARVAPGGDVSIEANNIYLYNNALVSARNLETGKGGSISITAGDVIQSDNSMITVTAEQGEGGSINITAPEISLTNQAVVSAKTSGAGDAGKLDIAAGEKLWMDQSSINSEAIQADGGNIKIYSNGRVNLWDSEITASVGGGPATVGGNIIIDHPDFVTLSNSDIIANAYEGKGGNISIITDIFLADDDSRVDASSELGIDGEILIDAIVTDISGTVSVLPDDFLDISLLLGDSCFVRTKSDTSSLVVSSPGSLPIGPNDSLSTSVRDLFWGGKDEND